MVTALASQVAWGTIPDWTAATGRAGALIFGAIALNNEARKRREDAAQAERNRREEERDRLEREQLQEAAQARLISVWSPNGWSSGPDGFQYSAEVQNNTDLPIYDLSVFLAPR